MSDEISFLRKELHKQIEMYGLNYEKVIETDRRLHDAIIKGMKETQKCVS